MATSLIQQTQRRRTNVFLESWFRLTSPQGNSRQDLTTQRGRLLSIIVLVLFVGDLVYLPATLSNSNQVLTIVLLTGPAVYILTLVLNRFGFVYAAAVLLIVWVDIRFPLVIVFSSVGLSSYSLPNFDLMVIAEIPAVLLLAPEMVFGVAAMNSAFITYMTFSFRRTVELSNILASNNSEIYLRPIILHGLIAVVAYIGVRILVDARQRADAAEAIATMERLVTEQQQHEMERQRKLAEAIQDISQTHAHISNGNLAARVSQEKSNELWNIGGSLNTLLNRYEAAQRELGQTRRTGEAAHHLARLLEYARETGEEVQMPQTATEIDEVTMQLNYYLKTRASGALRTAWPRL